MGCDCLERFWPESSREKRHLFNRELLCSLCCSSALSRERCRVWSAAGLFVLSLPAEELIGYFVFLASNHLSCENDHGMHNGRDGQDLQKVFIFYGNAKLVSLKQRKRTKKQTNPHHAFASKPKINDLGSSSQGAVLADSVSL